MENYFKQSGGALSSYWIGLRQAWAVTPGTGTWWVVINCQWGQHCRISQLRAASRLLGSTIECTCHISYRDASAFRWEDGSSAFPTLIPSSQEYNGSDYSHWNRAGSESEPNGQACVYAGERAYYYFGGVVTGDRMLSSYIQTATSKDVLGWVDVQCDYKVAALRYICEFEGTRQGHSVVVATQSIAHDAQFDCQCWHWVHLPQLMRGVRAARRSDELHLAIAATKPAASASIATCPAAQASAR